MAQLDARPTYDQEVAGSEEETDESKQHKPNRRTKSTKISSLFPKRSYRNTKRNEKHKNKMTHGKTHNKSSRRLNHLVE